MKHEAKLVYLPTQNAPVLNCGCAHCHNEYGNALRDLDPDRYRYYDMPFIVCETCGNKRCPRATYHDHECTRSNEPGQAGSMYGDFQLGDDDE